MALNLMAPVKYSLMPFTLTMDVAVMRILIVKKIGNIQVIQLRVSYNVIQRNCMYVQCAMHDECKCMFIYLFTFYLTNKHKHQTV